MRRSIQIVTGACCYSLPSIKIINSSPAINPFPHLPFLLWESSTEGKKRIPWEFPDKDVTLNIKRQNEW